MEMREDYASSKLMPEILDPNDAARYGRVAIAYCRMRRANVRQAGEVALVRGESIYMRAAE